jgi:hypothetical protein
MISSEDISKLESENNDEDANDKHETEHVQPDPCCFVAVHIGAGFHSVSKTATYKQLCDRICSNVIKLLNKGCNARNGAALAVALLEVYKNSFIFLVFCI